MLNVTVRRRRWLRATPTNNGSLSSYLLQHEGEGNKMCCLGFVCRAAGLGPSDIRGESSPETLFDTRKEYPKAIQKLLKRDTYPTNSRTCEALMEANDSHRLTAGKREARVKMLGKKVGINFSFVD